MDGFTFVDSKLYDFLESNSWIKYVFKQETLALCEWERTKFNEDHYKYIFYISYPSVGVKRIIGYFKFEKD